MKILITVGIILIIAAITNPKKEEHIDAVKKVFASEVMEDGIEQFQKGSGWDKAGTAIGMTFGMKAFETVLETIISVDNYVVFSLTRATFQGKTRIIGIGAFGNVFMVKGIEDGLQLQKQGE